MTKEIINETLTKNIVADDTKVRVEEAISKLPLIDQKEENIISSKSPKPATPPKPRKNPPSQIDLCDQKQDVDAAEQGCDTTVTRKVGYFQGLIDQSNGTVPKEGKVKSLANKFEKLAAIS